VRFDHVARLIVNADHSVMRAAAMLRVADCAIDRKYEKIVLELAKIALVLVRLDHVSGGIVNANHSIS